MATYLDDEIGTSLEDACIVVIQPTDINIEQSVEWQGRLKNLKDNILKKVSSFESKTQNDLKSLKSVNTKLNRLQTNQKNLDQTLRELSLSIKQVTEKFDELKSNKQGDRVSKSLEERSVARETDEKME